MIKIGSPFCAVATPSGGNGESSKHSKGDTMFTLPKEIWNPSLLAYSEREGA